MSIARHEEPPIKPMKLRVAFGAESLSANRLTSIELIFPSDKSCEIYLTRALDCTFGGLFEGDGYLRQSCHRLSQVSSGTLVPTAWALEGDLVGPF